MAFFYNQIMDRIKIKTREEAMFDIRKIQENAIYESVRAKSTVDIAREVVNSKDQTHPETNADWLKSAMSRLEKRFDQDRKTL